LGQISERFRDSVKVLGGARIHAALPVPSQETEGLHRP
jgi:hypothetical protein